MHKTESLLILAQHAIATLPDSISARKVLLGTIVDVLPRDHAARSDAQLLLQSIRKQDELQAELTLSYKTQSPNQLP
jgi:hypothetical protein